MPKARGDPVRVRDQPSGGNSTARNENLLTSGNDVQQARQVGLGLVDTNGLSHRLSLYDALFRYAGGWKEAAARHSSPIISSGRCRYRGR